MVLPSDFQTSSANNTNNQQSTTPTITPINNRRATHNTKQSANISKPQTRNKSTIATGHPTHLDMLNFKLKFAPACRAPYGRPMGKHTWPCLNTLARNGGANNHTNAHRIFAIHMSIIRSQTYQTETMCLIMYALLSCAFLRSTPKDRISITIKQIPTANNQHILLEFLRHKSAPHIGTWICFQTFWRSLWGSGPARNMETTFWNSVLVEQWQS